MATDEYLSNFFYTFFFKHLNYAHANDRLNMMGHFTFCAKNAQWEKHMMRKQILNRKKDTELLTLKKKSVTIFSAS